MAALLHTNLDDKYSVPESVLKTLFVQQGLEKTDKLEASEEVVGVMEKPKFQDSIATKDVFEFKSPGEAQAFFNSSYKSVRSSKLYRKRLISAKLREIIPLLESLNAVRGDKSKSVAALLNIKKLLRKTWNIIESEDRDIALTVSLLEKLISSDFWKSYTEKLVDSIKDILLGYITTSEENCYENLSKLLSENDIFVVPQLPNER